MSPRPMPFNLLYSMGRGNESHHRGNTFLFALKSAHQSVFALLV